MTGWNVNQSCALSAFLVWESPAVAVGFWLPGLSYTGPFLNRYSEEMQMREAQGSLRPGSLGAIIAGEVVEME